MAFNLQMIEQIAAWCFASTELADERNKASRRFFGEDDPRPAKYTGETGTENSRERRFLSWFMFDYVLPSGEKPSQLAARRLSMGSQRAEALAAVTGARFVFAQVGGIVGKSVFLSIEDEEFEVRGFDWAGHLRPHQAVLAHLVPIRHGYWLPAPGWIIWPISIGPDMRKSLKKFQTDAIETERFLQGRSEAVDDIHSRNPVQDDTLEKAVARMTTWATEKGYTRLVMSPAEWQSLVLRYLTKREPLMGQYMQEIVKKAGPIKTKEEFQDLADLTTNIWNNTPQPDRGGKTANQLIGRQILEDS